MKSAKREGVGGGGGIIDFAILSCLLIAISKHK